MELVASHSPYDGRRTHFLETESSEIEGGRVRERGGGAFLVCSVALLTMISCYGTAREPTKRGTMN